MTWQRSIAIVWLTALACSPAIEHTLQLVLLVDGGTATRRTLSYDATPFRGVDIDHDGSEQLLASNHGVFTIDDRGRRTSLTTDIASFAAWVEDDTEEAAHLFALVDGPRIRHARCDVSADPICRPAGELDVPRDVQTFAVAQFDGDGVLDLVTWGARKILVWRGGLDGNDLAWGIPHTFGEADAWIKTSQYQLVVSDFDDDGRTDVAVAGGGGDGDLRVFFGASDGASALPVVVPDNPNGFVGVVAADVDGDMRLDLVGLAVPPVVYLNRGARVLEPLIVGHSNDESLVVVGDFIAGGGADFLLLDLSSTHARIASMTETGDFAFVGIEIPPLIDGFDAQLAAVDFAGDGTDDIAVLVEHES